MLFLSAIYPVCFLRTFLTKPLQGGDFLPRVNCGDMLTEFTSFESVPRISLHTVTFVFFYVSLGFKPFHVKPFSSTTIRLSAFLQIFGFILVLFNKSKSPVLLLEGVRF